MIDTHCAPRHIRPLALSVLGVLILFALASLYWASPPAAVPATAPESEFSAERAHSFMRGLATGPRPAGSTAIERAREYIEQTLRSMGIPVEAHPQTYVDGRDAGEVVNVLARIPGSANTKAIAFMAHYDSVPYGPGAMDDGAGVSTLLETARALKAGPPLMNDVIFVFTDAEERGLLGAKAFAQHPWFKDVGVLLNFEARGTRGASLMFETSAQNGWLIDHLTQANVYPRASSLMYDIYQWMPFKTDLDALKPLGVAAMNFAFVGNFAYYHTKNDNPDHACLASLQHHGSYALGLARRFGNRPLYNITAPDVVYFNTVGSHMVVYSFRTSRALVVATSAAFLFALALGLARRRLTPGRLLRGVAVFGVNTLAAMAVTAILLGLVYGPKKLIALYWEDFTHVPDLRIVYRNDEYGWAFFLLTTGVMALLYTLWLRTIRRENLFAGALMWWFAAMLAMEVLLPGGAYLFYWPLLLGAAGLAILVTSGEAGTFSPSRMAWLTAFALPGIVLWLPMFQSVTSAVTVTAAPALMIIVCLLIGLVIPQIDLMSRLNKWWCPAFFCGAGFLVWLAATATNTPSPLRPNLNNLSYGLNLDTDEAFWMTSDEKTDEWTAGFFPEGSGRASASEFLLRKDAVGLKAPAPVIARRGPLLEVTEDQTIGGSRMITLRVTCPDKPTSLRLSVQAPQVFRATVFGQDIPGGSDDWSLRLCPMPRDSVTLTLELRSPESLKIAAVEEHLSLPSEVSIPPRPPHIIPEPNTVRRRKALRGERTFVLRSFELSARESP